MGVRLGQKRLVREAEASVLIDPLNPDGPWLRLTRKKGSDAIVVSVFGPGAQYPAVDPRDLQEALNLLTAEEPR